MAQTPNATAGSASTPRATNPLSLALPSQQAGSSTASAAVPQQPATASYFTATPSYPPTAHQYYQYAAAAGATPYRGVQTPAYPAYPSTPVTAGTPGTATAGGANASAYYPYGQAFNAAMYSGYLNSPALGGAGTTSTYPYGPIQTPTTATSAAAATVAVPSPQVNQAARTIAGLALPGAATTPAPVATTPAPVSATTSTAAPVTATQPASTAATVGAKGPGRKQTTFKGAFVKDLRNMMYGFGDDPNPAPDTVNVMEEILMEYIADVCATSLKTSRKHTIKLEDLRRALSRPADSKKLARMEELLFMQEDIKRARAQFDPADESVAKEMAGGAELGEEEEKPGKGKEKQRS